MSIKPKIKMTRKLAYFEGRGLDLKRYQLLLAVYYDRFEQAQAILETDPDQLNLQDPYGGLTALHIAIFRQNPTMVQLLLGQRETGACDNVAWSTWPMFLGGKRHFW